MIGSWLNMSCLFRRGIIVIRVWDKHLARDMMMWKRAEHERYCLAATFVEVSTAQG